MTPPGGWTGGFPEYQPRRPGPSPWRAKGKRPFGESWWGRAWVDALEGRARLDKNRLPRGRTYARTGAVGEVVVAPGAVSAPVQGSRPSPYRVTIRVAQFSDSEWDRVLDALASEIGHVAALVDGELLPSIAEDARSVGLDLLPGPGELQCHCSCPDWAEPCKHSAAVCYAVADSLDADPFGVLLMRGRSREEVLAALRERRGAGTGGGGRPGDLGARPDDRIDPGVLAREAWARSARHTGKRVERPAKTAVGGLPVAVPTAPDPPRRTGRPTVLAADPPADLGVDVRALRGLAADAAERALALLRGSIASGTALGLDLPTDLARRAATLVGERSEDGAVSAGLGAADELPALARRLGVPVRHLLWQAVAYREGGEVGLAVLEDVWDPGAAVVAIGVGMLGAGATARRNRVTLGTRQLRVGRDGRWYPFRKGRVSEWIPDGPPIEAAAVADDIDVGEVGELA